MKTKRSTGQAQAQRAHLNHLSRWEPQKIPGSPISSMHPNWRASWLPPFGQQKTQWLSNPLLHQPQSSERSKMTGTCITCKAETAWTCSHCTIFIYGTKWQRQLVKSSLRVLPGPWLPGLKRAHTYNSWLTLCEEPDITKLSKHHHTKFPPLA